MTFKKVKPSIYFSFLLLFSWSCRQNSGADPVAVRQEMRQREIVHLSQGQIMQRAGELADSLLQKAEADFQNRVSSLNENQTCLPQLESSIQQLEKQYPVKLTYLPFASGTGSRLKISKEKELYQAYEYSNNHHLPVLPNLQKDGEKDFLFTKALIISSAKCASCHRQLANPELRADMGDTIGIRMLRLSRKQVVMSFVE
jgi:hypothetical protein